MSELLSDWCDCCFLSLCVHLTVCERLFLSYEYEYSYVSVLMIFMIHGMKWEGIFLYYM